jgi:hypothetical protein
MPKALRRERSGWRLYELCWETTELQSQNLIELVKPQAVQGAEGEAARYACRGRAIACESYFLVPQKSSQAGLSFWPARQVRDLSQPLG